MKLEALNHSPLTPVTEYVNAIVQAARLEADANRQFAQLVGFASEAPTKVEPYDGDHVHENETTFYAPDDDDHTHTTEVDCDVR